MPTTTSDIRKRHVLIALGLFCEGISATIGFHFLVLAQPQGLVLGIVFLAAACVGFVRGLRDIAQLGSRAFDARNREGKSV